MKLWSTIIYAKSPLDGEMKPYGGPDIKAFTKRLAREHCETHGLGYCHIGDEILVEIPCKKGTYEPDWKNKVDYDQIQNN